MENVGAQEGLGGCTQHGLSSKACLHGDQLPSAMVIVFEAPMIGQNFVFPNCHVWQTNPAYPTSLFLISCLKLWGKMELPLAWQFLLVESALPDRSACPYELAEEGFFSRAQPRTRGGAHTFLSTLAFTRGSIFIVRTQTPDGWITVAGPRNTRTGAASCLQSYFSEEAVRLTGSGHRQLIARASRRCFKGKHVCLKICGPLRSFKDLDREKRDVFCIDLW